MIALVLASMDPLLGGLDFLETLRPLLDLDGRKLGGLLGGLGLGTLKKLGRKLFQNILVDPKTDFISWF